MLLKETSAKLIELGLRRPKGVEMEDRTLDLAVSLVQAVSDVRQFMTESGQLEKDRKELGSLYARLVDEEVNAETMAAFSSFLSLPNERNAADLNDGIADSIWVLLGLAISFNLPIAQQWEEVAKANFDKLRGSIRREDGKIMKPADWTPPDSEGVIREYWEGV